MFTILIPTDYSPGSANAIRYALRLTAGLPCHYVFFHADITPVAVYSSLTVSVLPHPPATARKLLTQYVSKVNRSLEMQPDKERISFLTAEGYSAAREITDAAEKVNADLVIMSARQAKGLKRLAFGSTAAGVIANPGIPVLAVPETYRYSPIVKVLAASELKNIKAELKVILPWARLFSAEVEVIHFTDATIMDANLISMAEEAIKQSGNKKLRLVVKALYSGDTLVHDILKTIRRQKADMIIMFRHPHNLLGRMLSVNTTAGMAYALPVPMLSLSEDI
jgi:nucleotide-binding universal stress UspA family protein